MDRKIYKFVNICVGVLRPQVDLQCMITFKSHRGLDYRNFQVSTQMASTQNATQWISFLFGLKVHLIPAKMFTLW